MTPDDGFAQADSQEPRPNRATPRKRPQAAAPQEMDEEPDAMTEELAPPPESLKDLIADNPIGAVAVAFITGIVVGGMVF